MSEKRILVIEDDADAANVLEAYLVKSHFQVDIAANGLAGLEKARTWKPDLILLDVMLPQMSGNDVLFELRKKSDVPVIMVSAMGDEPDKIGALRYGADDYVVKPYNPREVVARVQAVLRRVAPRRAAENKLCYEALELDLDSLTVKVNISSTAASYVELTPTEFNLLATLLRAPTKAFSRFELLEACLPESDSLERVVDTHIYNLRKKLEEHQVSGVLLTVRAVGYRFRQP